MPSLYIYIFLYRRILLSAGSFILFIVVLVFYIPEAQVGVTGLYWFEQQQCKGRRICRPSDNDLWLPHEFNLQSRASLPLLNSTLGGDMTLHVSSGYQLWIPVAFRHHSGTFMPSTGPTTLCITPTFPAPK